MVPVAGLEPARVKYPSDFKSEVSTIPPHRQIEKQDPWRDNSDFKK